MGCGGRRLSRRADAGKTATRITTGSELRDEISMAPLSGIGGRAIQSSRHRRVPRRATTSNKLVGSAYPAVVIPLVPEAGFARGRSGSRTGRTRLTQPRSRTSCLE